MIYSSRYLTLGGKAHSSKDPSIEANNSEMEASIDSFKGKLELPQDPLASIILHTDSSFNKNKHRQTTRTPWKFLQTAQYYNQIK